MAGIQSQQLGPHLLTFQQSPSSRMSALSSPTQITSPLPVYSSPGRSSYQEGICSPKISSPNSTQPVYKVNIGVGVKGLSHYPPRESPPSPNKQNIISPTKHNQESYTYSGIRKSTLSPLCFNRAVPQALSKTRPNSDLNPYWKLHQVPTYASRSGTYAAWV